MDLSGWDAGRVAHVLGVTRRCVELWRKSGRVPKGPPSRLLEVWIARMEEARRVNGMEKA